MPEQPDHIKENVLEKIRTSEVRMKPRYHFVLKVAFISFLAVLSLSASAFLFSYIFFSIQVTHHLFLVGFGERGIITFLLFFPWQILAIDIVLLLILERMLKQFKFGYRSPLAYLFLAILALAIVFAIIINETSFHQGLLDEAEHNHLPVVGGFYDHLRAPPLREQGLFRGIVDQVASTTFTIYPVNGDDGSSSVTVVVPPGTLLVGVLQSGDEVFIAGDATGTTIQAYGLRKVTNEINH
jgi:hypothetical protein